MTQRTFRGHRGNPKELLELQRKNQKTFKSYTEKARRPPGATEEKPKDLQEPDEKS